MTNYNSHDFIDTPSILPIRELMHRKVDNLTVSASCSTKLNLDPDLCLSDSKPRGKDTALALQMSGQTGKPSAEWECEDLSSMPEREGRRCGLLYWA